MNLLTALGCSARGLTAGDLCGGAETGSVLEPRVPPSGMKEHITHTQR